MNVQKVNRLKAIANNVFNVNVDSKTRDTHIIEARAACYTILRDDLQYTYSQIGQSFLKNHATVMHHVKQFPFWIKFNKGLSDRYDICRDMFKKNEELFDDGVEIVDMMLIKKSVDKLEKTISELSLTITHLEMKLNNLKNSE